MAIPVGTTARQLGAVARWMLAGLLIAGMLTWWWPGFRSWGALSAGVVVVLALWLTWRTAAADRTVPGHPVYLVLLGPAAVLTVHLAGTGLSPARVGAFGLAGAMNISMIFQMALLAGGIMLTQSLLPGAAAHAGVLSVCGAAMMGGPATAMIWGRAETLGAHGALTLLAFSGVAVWLAPLGSATAPGRRGLRAACVGVAVAACGLLAWIRPLVALLAAGVTGGVLILAGVIFPAWRRRLLLGGGALAIVVAGVLAACRQMRPDLGAQRTTWLGRGEAAFSEVSAADNGLVVLAGTIGWVGLGWLLAGSALCIVWLLWGARRTEPAARRRAVVWTVATALAGTAMLMQGGLFIPSVTLAVAFTWGLLPTMLARTARRQPGVLLLEAVVALLVLLGLARAGGLPTWAGKAFGADRDFLHVPAGFLLAMTLAWLLGCRKPWAGLAGIGLAALAGGVGELLQMTVVSWRGGDLNDLLLHLAGCAAAVVPYLLCMGSRWCESPDARPKGRLSAGPYAGF